jgi:integrase
VAHFLPHFGARGLDEITKSGVVRYLGFRRTQMTGNSGHKRRRLVSESTIRRERGLLQSIFERAIDEGHDTRNPFRGIKRGRDQLRTRVLTLEEEAKLLEALHPRFQRFVRFALVSGCRLDEIRGIDPKRDIDSERHRPRGWQVRQGARRPDAARRASRARGAARGMGPFSHDGQAGWTAGPSDWPGDATVVRLAANQQVKIPVAPRPGGNVVRMPQQRQSAGAT